MRSLAEISTNLLLLFLAFISPIKVLLYVIITVCLFDLITAIWRDIKISKLKGFDKIREIKSKKIRRTITKIFLYVIFISLFFTITNYTIILGIYLTKIATFLIAITELYSISENIGIITGKNIIVKIIKNIFKFSNEKINKFIEDDEKIKS